MVLHGLAPTAGGTLLLSTGTLTSRTEVVSGLLLSPPPVPADAPLPLRPNPAAIGGAAAAAAAAAAATVLACLTRRPSSGGDVSVTCMEIVRVGGRSL
jgi:hypothetical protein